MDHGAIVIRVGQCQRRVFSQGVAGYGFHGFNERQAAIKAPPPAAVNGDTNAQLEAP